MNQPLSGEPNPIRPLSGEPNPIRAFVHRFALTITELAELLDIEPETLRRYEQSGAPPPWITYALLGLGYRYFGVVLEGTPDERCLPHPRQPTYRRDAPAAIAPLRPT